MKICRCPPAVAVLVQHEDVVGPFAEYDWTNRHGYGFTRGTPSACNTDRARPLPYGSPAAPWPTEAAATHPASTHLRFDIVVRAATHPGPGQIWLAVVQPRRRKCGDLRSGNRREFGSELTESILRHRGRRCRPPECCLSGPRLLRQERQRRSQSDKGNADDKCSSHVGLLRQIRSNRNRIIRIHCTRPQVASVVPAVEQTPFYRTLEAVTHLPRGEDWRGSPYNPSMAQWLVKEEPDHYGYDQLERDGKTVWAGVRNPLAQKHLRGIRKGDRSSTTTRARRRRSSPSRRPLTDAYPDPVGRLRQALRRGHRAGTEARRSRSRWPPSRRTRRSRRFRSSGCRDCRSCRSPTPNGSESTR